MKKLTGNDFKSLTFLQNKFQNQALDEKDESSLLFAIMDSNDISELESAIYMYSYSFPINEQVEVVCKKYIDTDHIEPGLTAVCLEALIRHWDVSYLDINGLKNLFFNEDYDVWYDEVLFLKNISD